LGGDEVSLVPSTSDNLIIGDDPQAFITHAGRVCYTASDPIEKRKLFCLSGINPIQVGNTNPGNEDDPEGLLSTPSGLYHASVPPGLSPYDKKIYLSPDLVSSTQVPFDEDYVYSGGTSLYFFP
jgi:hypothetical protein